MARCYAKQAADVRAAADAVQAVPTTSIVTVLLAGFELGDLIAFLSPSPSRR